MRRGWRTPEGEQGREPAAGAQGAAARSRGDRAERGIRSYEGEKVTDRWASLQVIASDLDILMLAVVILQSSTFSGFLYKQLLLFTSS